jgi:hypothetical protein
MAIRQPLSTGTSESSIIFYNGGHNHDGISSALISTAKYSIYDFTTDFIGTDSRQSVQSENFRKFKNVIADIVKTDVLTTAGITLTPNQVRAENISAGAVTATSLAANIVLVNNVIKSNNYVIGVSGWAINSNGTAEFANTSIRGAIVANSVSTPGVDIFSNGTLAANSFTLYGNGAIVTSSGKFSVDADGNLFSNSATITGTVTATSVSTPGLDIDANGNLQANNFALYANGMLYGSGGSFQVSAAGVLSATGATISGTVTASSLQTTGIDIDASGNLTANNFALYANGAIVTSSGNFAVDVSGNLSANNASITGILNAETGSRIGNFYFNNFGLTNGSGPGLSGPMQLDTFNNIIYAPFFKASDGQDKTEIKMGVIEMDRWGVGGPAQIRFNRERISPNNERYLAFALAGYQSGNVIGSINQTSATGVNYLTTSDSRLKINVDKPYDAIVVINTLIPRLYKWSLDDEGNEHLGFFAQELYEVYPDAVGVGIDASEQDIDLVREDPWGIDYSKITPLLTKAVQELCVKVEVLEQKVVELESN